MDVFVFVVIIVAIGCGTGIVTSYFENKGKSGSKISDAEFAEIVSKLDKTITRVETLERLALDSDQDLKREFRNL
ncbi:hypothetical protein [Hirschia baltica]|uniref:Phage shock protein B n=1 Tax=Hirschia baltica (strain ATCC 49814 / DSM 5838 / IFAM 1418) TaxID=582402 RepID=C6XR70_HIRBI|nr:hypothetical protein [Hirschia baltica]ACT60601.1 hypothetical protein Hbal_2932 [Hirschia baltica ATCC 49814]